MSMRTSTIALASFDGRRWEYVGGPRDGEYWDVELRHDENGVPCVITTWKYSGRPCAHYLYAGQTPGPGTEVTDECEWLEGLKCYTVYDY